LRSLARREIGVGPASLSGDAIQANLARTTHEQYVRTQIVPSGFQHDRGVHDDESAHGVCLTSVDLLAQASSDEWEDDCLQVAPLRLASKHHATEFLPIDLTVFANHTRAKAADNSVANLRNAQRVMSKLISRHDATAVPFQFFRDPALSAADAANQAQD
jgi:hypothetical protein